ncbi:MAG: hypothetical protein PVI33_05930 [Candidatus Omnitrophota bacterium]|jgi:hypothetical protein
MNRLKSQLGSKNQGARGSLPLGSFFLVLVSFFFIIGMARQPKPAVYIRKYKDSRYQLLVDNKPYIIKGVCYSPVPIGQNHEYDLFSDPNKPWIADGRLMKEMGINTVRFYGIGDNPEQVKQVIRDLYQLYGIRSILGDWLSFWEYPCPRYGDEDFREKAKRKVLDMVNLYKDEEGVLFWVLGNENNYSFSGRINPWSSEEIECEPDPAKQISMRAKIYYSFVNELAHEIHKIDPNHPVALGNGELLWLDVANQVCPDIDLVACIIYRGKSFGNLFESLKNTFDRPVVLAEFGADSWDAYKKREDQDMQAYFLELQWREIYKNLYNHKDGAGNCLGGTIFEWTDEWWKHYEYAVASWPVHDTGAGWSNGSYYFDIRVEGNMNMNEEWFGIVAISEELQEGINKRIPRRSYYVLQELWKNPEGKPEFKYQKSK